MQTNPTIEPGFTRAVGRASRLAVGLLVLGLAWRSVRYFLQFPIWGDEALLAMNFAWFDYGQMTTRLENCQIAPLLFLWGERTAYCWFGPGELSLRLLPFLASLASLALFWRLTGLVLNARARLFAVGFLAVAIWPVSMGSLIKPYSFDLFMSLTLLLLAVEWVKRPEQWGWLALLVVFAPLALLGSYPAVFVAGGVSLALLRPAWEGSWRIRGLVVAFHLTLFVGFALAYTIGNNHLDTPTNGVTTRQGMSAYWAATFPPGNPLYALWWLVVQSTGQMAAYPIGASNGGSILTVLLCLGGVSWWVRQGQRTWILLFGTPLILNLMAGLVHRYPYGGSCRLCQHLAPTICIFAGVGLAAFLQRLSWPSARRRGATLVVAGMFAMVGLVGILGDIAHPQRDEGCAWMRSSMQAIRAEIPDTDPVVICGTPQYMECVFSWYWLNEGERVTWGYETPTNTRSCKRVWGFFHGRDGDAACLRLNQELLRQDSTWRLVKRIPQEFCPRRARETPQRCELFCFERLPEAIVASSRRR